MIAYCICDCFELLLTSLGRSRKITIQKVALNSTNTAEMQIKWKACFNCCWRQTKEGTPVELQANALNFLVRWDWIYDNDLALTYTKGAKEEKWGTNCKDPVGKLWKKETNWDKVKHCIAVQIFKDFRRTCGQKELQLPLLGFRLFLLDGVDGRCEQIIGMRVELISTSWLGSSSS